MTIKMSDIVNDVLDELRLASGQDVQIHLQNGVMKNIARLYRTLSKEYTFQDQMSYHTVATALSDGAPTTDVSSFLTKYTRLHSVFLPNTQDPLPRIPPGQNPFQVKRPAVLPMANEPTKVFAIYPKLARTDIVVVTKNYEEEDFEMDDDILFDRDILAVGTAYQLSVKMGVNDLLTKTLETQFAKLLSIATQAELVDIQANLQRGAYPTEWQVNE